MAPLRHLWALILLSGVLTCDGAERIVHLRNGLRLQGSIVELASIDQNAFQAAAGPAIEAKPIWMIDDGLRRIYLNQRGMVIPPANVAPAEPSQAIILAQKTPIAGGKAVNAVGSILGVSPFDDYGRRTFTMQGAKGPLTVHQGMTEINARYIKVSGLASTRSFVWESCHSTDTFPSSQLYRILSTWTDDTKLDDRLKIYRFFVQAGRYVAAREVLKRAIKDFPDTEGLTRQLRTLAQQEANQILDQAISLRESGQPEFAMRMLNGFRIKDVAIETRIKVEDAIKQTENENLLAESLLKLLDKQVASLPPATQTEIQPLLAEIKQDLDSNTLVRLSEFKQFGNDDNIAVENRIALAIGSWLMGPGSGEQNLAVARALIEVRRLVRDYLQEDDRVKRSQTLAALVNQEGATPLNVSRIIKTMKPPRPLPTEFADSETPGLYRITLPENGPVEERTYLLQLPGEYSPLRNYPCIVSLHRPGRSLDEQITWWTGEYSELYERRMGPASRKGFIVIAPEWQNEGLSGYRFTAREHYRVLSALRDAMRMTSIDPDRVFISGHSAGGSAAWDIGISHPDIWAGMLPISADADKYIRHYANNGTRIPEYFVMGELAGYPAPLIRNGAVLQRYLKPDYDAMIVSYQGRGEEDFYDEIDEMIEWMLLRSHRRLPPPQRIEASTMRAGDDFFWWLELDGLKQDISPFLWDQTPRLRAAEIKAQITANGDINIGNMPAESCTVYLSPNMGIDLDKIVRVSWGSKVVPVSFDGSLEQMLEDVRTKGDRQRFCWTCVTLP